MKKQLLSALLLVSSVAIAEEKMPTPRPAKEMDQLRFFDGEWKCDGNITASEMGPAHAFKATANTKLEANNMWYAVGYTEEKSKEHGMAHTARGYWGYDPSSNKFVRMFVGSHGDWETATSQGWTGDTMVWQGEAHNYMNKPKVEFKHTFVKKGNNEFSDKFEIKKDGAWTTQPGSVICKKPTTRS